MVNCEHNTNSSQFYITLGGYCLHCFWINHEHTVSHCTFLVHDNYMSVRPGWPIFQCITTSCILGYAITDIMSLCMILGESMTSWGMYVVVHRVGQKDC